MDLALWFSPPRLIRIALLLVLGLAAIFVEAAPLGLAADATPSPDILFCVVAYWSTRRPGSTALIAVFALGLARDLMTDAPVGAGVLTLVFASEFLKALGHGLSRRSFATEWLLLATVLALVIMAQWLIVLILLAHPPYLTDLAYQWLATMALYPVLALIFRWLFRIGWRKGEPAPGAGMRVPQ
jgi:rod shape-determining protein MreD